MRRSSSAPLYWGIALLLLGVFFTLFTFGVLASYEREIVWGITAFLVLSGVGFLAYTAWRPSQWWFLIPGFLLLSMAAVVYLGIQMKVGGPVLAATIFWGLGLAHLFVFLTRREERWWAWIPAGGFLVLAAAVVWGEQIPGPVLSAGLFVGMGVVFLFLYAVLPSSLPRWWALFLAVAFVIIAAFVFTVSVGSRSLVARGWAIGLALVGIALIAWGVSRLVRPQQPLAPPSMSGPPPLVTPEGSVVPVPEEIPSEGTPSKATSSSPQDEAQEGENQTAGPTIGQDVPE